MFTAPFGVDAGLVAEVSCPSKAQPLCCGPPFVTQEVKCDKTQGTGPGSAEISKVLKRNLFVQSIMTTVVTSHFSLCFEFPKSFYLPNLLSSRQSKKKKNMRFQLIFEGVTQVILDMGRVFSD